MSLVKKIGVLGIALFGFLPVTKIKSAEKFIRGDVDGNRVINIVDPITALNYLFRRGPELSCLDAADSNDDGRININDGVYTLNYLFRRGPRPSEPFLNEGYDLTRDNLRCRGQADLENIIEIRQQDIPLVIRESGTKENPKIYVLREDVSTRRISIFSQIWNAIIIQDANNIILDGLGHRVIYGAPSDLDVYGILVRNSRNIAINNLVMYDNDNDNDNGRKKSAIFFDNVNFGSIGNNRIAMSRSSGSCIRLEGGELSQIVNNMISVLVPDSDGILFYSSPNNLFSNNRIEADYNSRCISLISSDRNIFVKNVINSSSEAKGIYLEGSIFATHFFDSSINEFRFANYDIFFGRGSNGWITLTNVNYPNDKVFFESNKVYLNREWYLDVLVRDGEGALEGVDVRSINRNNVVTRYPYTDETGRIGMTLLSYRQYSNERFAAYPYRISVSKKGYVAQSRVIELNRNAELEFVLERRQ